MFFRIICSELLRRFTEETLLFEIFFHFSSIKTFPLGLFLVEHISVFQVNVPKSMNFLITSESFALAVFYLMNALVYVDIDQGIYKVKFKVARNEIWKKLQGFSFSINSMANFEAFRLNKKLSSNLYFLKSVFSTLTFWWGKSNPSFTLMLIYTILYR